MERKPIIAIDFDGTIVEHEYPKIGEFIEGAQVALHTLDAMGFDIIIWTCRGGMELVEMENFLKTWGLKYTAVNKNASPNLGFSPFPKVYADVYIDDRMIGGLQPWPAMVDWLLRKYIPPKLVPDLTKGDKDERTS